MVIPTPKNFSILGSLFFLTACASGPQGPSADYVRRTDKQYEIHVSGNEREPMNIVYRGAFDICRTEQNLGFELKEIQRQHYPAKDPESLPQLASIQSIVECTGSIDPYLEKKFAKSNKGVRKVFSNHPFDGGIEMQYSSSSSE